MREYMYIYIFFHGFYISFREMLFVRVVVQYDNAEPFLSFFVPFLCFDLGAFCVHVSLRNDYKVASASRDGSGFISAAVGCSYESRYNS